MYKNYNGYAKHNISEQIAKVIYNIRDNMESQVRTVAGLKRSIKDITVCVKDIVDILQESGYVPRGQYIRQSTLASDGDCKKQVQVLQQNIACNETDGVHMRKKQHRRRMGSVLLQGSPSNEEASSSNRVAIDISNLHGGISDSEDTKTVEN